MMLFDTGALLLGAATIAALSYLLVFCYRPVSWPKTLVKTASVALLALIAAMSGGAWGLTIALICCAAGDYFLSREGDTAFLSGVGSFAAGHLVFAWLFLTLPDARVAVLVEDPRLWIVIGLVLYGVIMMRLLFAKAGDLRFAVLGYVPVIVAMALAALSLPSIGWLLLIQVAAFSFMLSDSVLAAELFLLPAESRWRRITPFIIWAFYWLAQAGFLLGVVLYSLE